MENLRKETKEFLTNLFANHHFTFQEKKQLSEFAIDFEMWGEKPINEIFADFNLQKNIFEEIRKIWNDLKTKHHSYKNFKNEYQKKSFEISHFSGDKIALGRCPVASENTRCCNLMTLDAVKSCGFDCSYCSIQSFYNDGKIGFDDNFAKNLENLKLDKNRTYHIGTGQSSDSLMWGDKFGILSALCKFAQENPNVILEFKTKSNNVKFLLENEISRNIIVTFSLNPQVIIDNEEHLTTSLNERLEAALKLAKKGILVGFHFHPIIWYENYQSDYGEIFKHIQTAFKPQEIALISFGTLTFIKPVIKKLRKRNLRSKILQMPLCDANGKFSYPLSIKKEIFKFAYESFTKWHNKVFFYMCMEDKSLWSECFGYEYATNDEMEIAMKNAYFAKINHEI